MVYLIAVIIGLVLGILGLYVLLHQERKDKRAALALARDASNHAASEYQRALKDGKRLVYEFAVHANANLWEAEGTPFYQAKVRAVLQDAVNKFNPAKNDLAE